MYSERKARQVSELVAKVDQGKRKVNKTKVRIGTRTDSRQSQSGSLAERVQSKEFASRIDRGAPSGLRPPDCTEPRYEIGVGSEASGSNEKLWVQICRTVVGSLTCGR